MGNEVSTVGGAIATAATSVAAGVTLGQVQALNNAAKECASYTAEHAQETTVRHVGETAAHAVATVSTAVATGVTFGQVDVLNQAVVACASNTANSAVKACAGMVKIADEVSDGVPGVAHVKGGILYAVGQNERADRAMKTGSRTLGAMVGGAAGFVVRGPTGAVAGGVAAGAVMDGIITATDSAVHQEFRPWGQIAAWNAVAQGKSSEEVIGGLIGGVVTPIMDGVIGLGSGKAYEKWKLNKDLKILESFLESDGSVSLDEAFDAMESISKNSTPGATYADMSGSVKDATFDWQRIPKEAITDERVKVVKVYRGDISLQQPGMMERIFEEGVATRGPVNDAFMHARDGRECNYVSTSKKFGIAREFGSFTPDPPKYGRFDISQPQRYGILKINARRGVDLPMAADLLDRRHLFAEYVREAEVAIYERVLPQNIEGALVSDSHGGVTWSANPNYVPPGPPAFVDVAGGNPNALHSIAAVLVVSGRCRSRGQQVTDLFTRSLNMQQEK